jgi:hypothetical protein
LKIPSDAASFSISAIIRLDKIIGTVKTKDNGKGLGLLFYIHSTILLKDLLLLFHPHMPLTIPYPLTQSIM